MVNSIFMLNRILVSRRGHVAYDESFQAGVNIIHGENGSGKSSVSDFIFYILGGEFDSWKSAAKHCDLVQAEVETKGGKITLRREIESKTTPIYIYFGSFEDAQKADIDSWNKYPIRRSESQESFSQIFFRCCGIPEAQSQNASNITMHQIMRLLYADQKTIQSDLFRFDKWDTKDIRKAVADLLCGINVYESYDLGIKLGELNKVIETTKREMDMLIANLPNEKGQNSVSFLHDAIKRFEAEKIALMEDIQNVDNLISAEDVGDFVKNRSKAKASIQKMNIELSKLEKEVESLTYENIDIQKYIDYLNDVVERLPKAEKALEIIGSIEFSHCPSCLAKLKSKSDEALCIVCGQEVDVESEKSKYLHIRLDLEIQLRESKQLQNEKSIKLEARNAEIKVLKRTLDNLLSQFSILYETSASPRESFLAEKHMRLGEIDGVIREYIVRKENALRLSKVVGEYDKLKTDYATLEIQKNVLDKQGQSRRLTSHLEISALIKAILAKDLTRQDEFLVAKNVEIDFEGNSIMIDGEADFAESSNVILKNATILSMLFAAVDDVHFYHPRFALMDNIEDKGMEDIRSHRFQEIIVEMSSVRKSPHQIILTTSKISPLLLNSRYVRGRKYTRENHTLDLGIPSATIPEDVELDIEDQI